MLSYMSSSAYTFVDVLVNSSPTGILVTLGSLLFVVSTALRRTLPSPEETAGSPSGTISTVTMPLSPYAGTVEGLANSKVSRRHASAV
jgi:hypothetical protein